MELPFLEATLWETAKHAAFNGDTADYDEMVGLLAGFEYIVRRLPTPVDHLVLTHPRSDERLRFPLVDPGTVWTDPEATANRIRTIDAYMRSGVLDAAGFRCPSADECHASATVKGRDVYEGQLSYIGHHYDHWIGASRARVAIIGQEYGHPPALMSLLERYRFVRDGKGAVPFEKRNPHMRGTTLALRLLLGLSLDDLSDDIIRTHNGHSIHLFEAFALVNALLCSAVEPGTTRGRSTRTMQENCLPHFVHTLRILEPSIVVVQGKGVAKWIRPAFNFWQPRSDMPELVDAEHEGVPTLIATFTHPSAFGKQNWSYPTSEYFRSVVEPTLSHARRLLSGVGT